MKRVVLAAVLGFATVGLADEAQVKSDGKVPEKLTDTKAKEKAKTKAVPKGKEASSGFEDDKPGDLLINSGSGDEIIRVTADGDLLHRGKKIADKDAIISAFYDVVISRTNGYANCLNALTKKLEQQSCEQQTKK